MSAKLIALDPKPFFQTSNAGKPFGHSVLMHKHAHRKTAKATSSMRMSNTETTWTLPRRHTAL